MPTKNRHPEREILEFVNGALTGASCEAVAAHLRECNKCAAVAAVIGALKNQAHAQSGPKTNLGIGYSGDPGTVAYGLPIPTSVAKSSESGQTDQPPGARRDLEFKDLLLSDPNVSRPMLGDTSGSTHPPPPLQTPDSSDHLDNGELASFFYGELPREAAAAAAGHVALCSDCSSAISLFSDSEAAAQTAGSPAPPGSEMSKETWRLIKEWEENCLAEPRPQGDAVSREMLERFLEILRVHREEIDRVAAGPDLNQTLNPSLPRIVPVVVLGPTGGFRGVEAFHRLSRPRGLEALECEALDRFNNLPIHALLGSDRQYPIVISGRINRGMAELDYSSIQLGMIRPLGYFIVEN